MRRTSVRTYTNRKGNVFRVDTKLIGKRKGPPKFIKGQARAKYRAKTAMGEGAALLAGRPRARRRKGGFVWHGAFNASGQWVRGSTSSKRRKRKAAKTSTPRRPRGGGGGGGGGRRRSRKTTRKAAKKSRKRRYGEGAHSDIASRKVRSAVALQQGPRLPSGAFYVSKKERRRLAGKLAAAARAEKRAHASRRADRPSITHGGELASASHIPAGFTSPQMSLDFGDRPGPASTRPKRSSRRRIA